MSLAKAALGRARRWLQSAKRALEDGRWDDVVYSSQMAVEHSSKALLLAFGIDFPRTHDVSTAFKWLAAKRELPNWFLSALGDMVENISELAKLRGLAGYGYELGVSPDYFKGYAPEAYGRAERHLNACARLLKEVFGVEVK